MERKKQRRDEELLQKIILRVKELRHMHNHQSQEQLAEATELGIAQLESGKNFPNLTTISIICKFYNITLDEFFPAPLPAERKINPSGASAAAIAGANPISGKQITGKQITEKQINSNQEPAATIGNGQRTKKKVPLLRNLFTY